MSKFCPNCGTKNVDEASFCASCGNHLPTNEEVEQRVHHEFGQEVNIGSNLTHDEVDQSSPTIEVQKSPEVTISSSNSSTNNNSQSQSKKVVIDPQLESGSSKSTDDDSNKYIIACCLVIFVLFVIAVIGRF